MTATPHSLPAVPADHNRQQIPIITLTPRKRAYRSCLGISDPTIWRWTRSGKLSPPDAVINGREYSTAETIENDMRRLLSKGAGEEQP